MKQPQGYWALALALALGLCHALPAAADELVSTNTLATRVAVQGVSLQDGVVRGQVVNLSDERIENLRLAVTWIWHWKNERHPGADEPGSLEFLVVPAVAPHAAVDFSVSPAHPLPTRSDGWMDVSVSAVGLTSWR